MNISTEQGRRNIALFVAALLCFCTGPAVFPAYGQPKQVLILNSYHRGYPFSDAEMAGIDKAFSLKEFPLEIHTEFLDAKRFLDESSSRLIKDVLRHKYKNRRLDLILALDNDAFNFVIQERNQLFADVPIVFCGVNDFQDKMLEALTNITGVVEALDYEDTFKLAKRLIPALKRIVVISDETTTGRAHLEGSHQAEKPFEGELAFEDISLANVSMEELSLKLHNLNPDTAVVLLSHFVDKFGHVFSAEESEALITSSSSVPVFVVTDTRVAYGALGGKVVSGVGQGETAGKMALQVLRGQPIESVPLVRRSPNVYMFNYPVLQKFGIPLSRLPEDSIVLNQPDTLYKRLRTSLVTLGLLVLLLAIVVALMFNSNRKRRFAERALRESEKKYRGVVETANEGVFALDENFDMTFVNRRFSELLGYEQVDMIRSSITRFIHPDEIPDHYRRVNDRREGRSGSYERRFQRKDGQELVMHVNATPLFDHAQRFCGTLILVTDVTEQKRIEQELAHTHSLLLTAFEQSPAGIIIVDADSGTLKLLNKAAEEIYQESRQDLAAGAFNDKASWKCYGPDGEEIAYEDLPIFMALQGRLAENVELRVKRKDGTEKWLLANAAPVRNTSDKVVAAVSVFADISLQKQLQTDLQRTAKLESVGILAGGIAHDFNNLLSAIAGNAALAKLILSAEHDPRAERCLAEVERAAMRARDLTQQLLTFSRGGMPLKAITDLKPIMKEASSFALTGSRSRSEIKCGKLWPVMADAGQISQVLHNLVLNADQAMSREPGTIRIKADNIKLTPSQGIPLPGGPYVKVTVEDSGVGIPLDLLPKVFDPFFTTKQNGTGLGLASAYSIIKAHGGHICADSIPHTGSTFTFYLPARPESAPEGSSAREVSAPAKPLRILIMDDEPMIRTLLKDALNRFGHEVYPTSDGAAAIRAYETAKQEGRPFDIVILDLTVAGGMGGTEAVKELKKRDPSVIAVASSGYATDPVLAQYQEYGFSARLAKPYRLSDLQDLLRQLGEVHAKAMANVSAEA